MTLNVRLEELNPNYRDLAELIGLDNFMRLVENYAGYQLYIPKLDSIKTDERNERIRADFTGYNFKELALKYSLSERQIREITAPMLKLARAKPLDGQVTLFDSD